MEERIAKANSTRVERIPTGEFKVGDKIERVAEMYCILQGKAPSWANCKNTRNSTSAGVLRFGGCVLFHYVRTQSVIAQSSCEVEWYGLATGSAESLFLKELFERLGHLMDVKVYTDSTAAKAVGLRLGAGNLGPLE